MIDLRSDTVTFPTAEMREVMYRAEVGDDVYGEDPSINSLQSRAAEVLGKEAALYVPSGTMGNLCAHLAHTRPGEEVICGTLSHTFTLEQGGAARLAGLSYRTIPQQGAILNPKDVEAAIRPEDIHHPRTGLIWVEQPARGYVVPLGVLAQIAEVAHRHHLPMHMDGARIFNAAVYLGVAARAIAQYADSVMFCVSKGLAAPVGSLLVGTSEFIQQARRARKVVGGEMRQAGIIASAGTYAIEKMAQRLVEDHKNARLLADGLRKISGIELDRAEVQTNIFYFDLTSDLFTPRQFVEALKKRRILVSLPRGASRTFRLVTHYMVTREDVLATISAVREILVHDLPGETDLSRQSINQGEP